MRTVIAVSRFAFVPVYTKLFKIGAFRGKVGRYPNTFCATVLVSRNLCFAKAVRQGVPFTFVGRIEDLSLPDGASPSQGLEMIWVLRVQKPGGPSSAEKSPVRSAMVGNVEVTGNPIDCRYCSQAKKKKVLFLPSYTLGIHTGHPTYPRSHSCGHAAWVGPASCRTTNSRQACRS